jgi:hypothetical protein
MFWRGQQHLLALFGSIHKPLPFLIAIHVAVSLRPYQELALVRALWRSYARYQKFGVL